MNIYIDNIVLNFQRIGGISVYITKIIKGLLADKREIFLVEQENVGSNILRNELDVPEERLVPEKFLHLRLLSYLPIRVKLKEKSIVHSSYYRTCKDPLAANIVTVYDFNYELGYVRKGIRKFLHCWLKRRAVKEADGVICISESTRNDLLGFYPEVNPAKLKVIHLASDERFHQLPDEEVEHGAGNRKVVLFVGARSFHKNFTVCVETLQRLQDYDLYVVGPPLSDDEKRTLDTKLAGRYKNFSGVSTTDLNALYNEAFCFFYPTSYEGFGIPVLEAMQSGCPVVSTNRSSIPEVAGDAGLLVEEISVDAFVKKIRRLEDLDFRQNVVVKGFEQAKKFSWDKTYRETLAFYNEVYQHKFG